MSRQAASKSRAEKGPNSRGVGGGTQSIPVPSASDVVPGRLTDVEWNRLMLDEEDTAFIGTLVDDIIDLTLKGCYESYIWKQVNNILYVYLFYMKCEICFLKYLSENVRVLLSSLNTSYCFHCVEPCYFYCYELFLLIYCKNVVHVCKKNENIQRSLKTRHTYASTQSLRLQPIY